MQLVNYDYKLNNEIKLLSPPIEPNLKKLS